MKLEWSATALADLDRFAAFLHDRHPRLAKDIAAEIKHKTRILAEHPLIGRAIEDRPEYRELVLEVANARYIFRYGFDGERLVILRVSIAARRASDMPPHMAGTSPAMTAWGMRKAIRGDHHPLHRRRCLPGEAGDLSHRGTPRA